MAYLPPEFIGGKLPSWRNHSVEPIMSGDLLYMNFSPDDAAANVQRLVAWGQRGDGTIVNASARKIDRVGTIGAGLMGASIVAAHVQHGLPVVLHDSNPAALQTAPARIAAALNEIGHANNLDAIRSLVHTTDQIADVAQCDLILEAIVETLSAKQQLFRELQRVGIGHAIVASNTSTIPLRRMADCFEAHSQFCGLHFCHPVQRRPLVEVIHGPMTSEATLATASAHVLRLGRMPIAVLDGAGFVVNRLLFPCLGEALELLRQGVPAAWIDEVAESFGMEIGPLQLLDEIGLDTALQAAWVLAADFPERILPSPLLVSLVKAGRLGRKTGVGFFSHQGPTQDAAPKTLDPDSEKLLSRWRETCIQPDADTVLCRLVLPMLLEATRILDEGDITDPRAIDLAVLFGLGFPADKGGLLWWAESLGLRNIRERLRSLAALGDRFAPTPLLERMAQENRRFY